VSEGAGVQIIGSKTRPLPDGWRWVRLGDVCEERTEVRDPRSEPEKSFRYVDITSVDNSTKLIADPKTLLGGDAPSRARQVIRAGDVIVSTTRPNLNAVAMVPQDLDGHVCSTGFCVLRAKEGLEPAYLFAFVRSGEFVRNLSGLVKGALYPAVTDNRVRAQLIPFPPLPEQQRIAAILNEQMAAVKRARAAAEARLDAAKGLAAAYLRQFLPRPSGVLPDGWRWVRLGDVCDFLDSRRIPINDAERQKRIAGKAKSELFPYYGANGQVGWIDGYLFDEPLILLAEDGGNFGSKEKPIAYAVCGRYWVNNHAHVLRPRAGLDFDYCLHAIRIRPDVGELVSGSTRAKLNQEIAASIPLPLPPLPEQQRIGAFLTDQIATVKRISMALEEELKMINALPAALLRRAFSGEI
jgi:type I restriction enzyme S subunit